MESIQKNGKVKAYMIIQNLHCSANGVAVFPEGRSWGDVESWYVKWDELHVVFKDGAEFSTRLCSTVEDGVDWKRPSDVSVHAVDEDGNIDYDEDIG